MITQSKLIKQCTKFAKEELALLNEVKIKAEEIDKFIVKINSPHFAYLNIDPKWILVAEIDLKKGFMALIRAIEKP